MNNKFPGSLIAAVAALVVADQAAFALSLDVPITHPTLQAAVAAAAASLDPDNVITISASPVVTNATIDIGNAFGPGRRLTIRPVAAMARASVVNGNPTVPIFNMMSAGNVTLQDLDILRNITNGHHLVMLSTCSDIVIERCRIGSNWPTPGLAGFANVYMLYPTNVTLRNNIVFAMHPGTFDEGIRAGNFNDPANALRLYNNVVADHRLYGIRIEAGVPGSLVLLRNNVVVNGVTLAPEPLAYRTEVIGGGSTVVTSHNVAFASAGFIQGGPGAVDIAGFPTSLLTFARPLAAAAFVSLAWTMGPAYDVNPTFYDLVDGGPLHDDVGDYGLTVTNTSPDIAVLDDIDRELRPGGTAPHSDRGADQLEAGGISAVVVGPEAGGLLRGSARPGASGGVVVDFTTARGGTLELRLYDVQGRALGHAHRVVGAGASGTIEAAVRHGGGAGIVFYRLRLVGDSGDSPTVSGRIRLRD